MVPPGGGGYRIDGLYNVKPEFATVTAQNLGTIDKLLEEDYGVDLNRYQYYNGVDVTFNLRMASGVRFQGGASTGHTVSDSCGVRAMFPDTAPTTYDCHTAGAFLTPVATPANLMVMEPGGYRFGDYWKLGLPLLVLFGAVAVLLVPVIWSF